MLRLLVPALLALLLLLAAPASAREPVLLGAAVNDYPLLSGNEAFLDTLDEHYDSVVPESAMNIFALQPDEGEWDFDFADAHAAWARDHDKRMHAIPLIWCADNWTPGWVVFKDWTPETLRAWMTDYITTVMQRYAGTITSWDVVNEVYEPDGTLKDCIWSRVLGPSWPEDALRAARAADPSAALFINEYTAENPNGRKFRALEALARDLLARGVPLDGIGLQFHLFGTGPFQWQVEESFRRVAALGLRVQISEMDVPMNFLPGPSGEDKLRQQAEVYGSVAAACLRVEACGRLTTWGMTDAYSFRGPENASLPWDTSYRAKPAWEALQRVLRAPAPAPGNRVPGQPGTPVPAGDVATRVFTLSWGAAGDPDGEPLTYTLEQRAADGSIDWRPLATGLRAPSFAFTAARPERSGTWQYRVRASDGATDGPWSSDPAPIPVGGGRPDAGEDSGDGGSSGGSAGAAPAPLPPPPAPAPPPAPPLVAPRLALPAPAVLAPPRLPRSARVDRRGRVRLAVACPCRGRMTLTLRGRRIGAATLRPLAGGRRARATVTLTRTARRALARRRSLRIVARAPGRRPWTVTLRASR